MAKKQTSHNRLIRRKRLSIGLAILFAAITATVGYLVLKGSFAFVDTQVGEIGIVITDTAGNPLSGATAYIRGNNSVSMCADQPIAAAVSGADGIALISGCVGKEYGANFTILSVIKSGYAVQQDHPNRKNTTNNSYIDTVAGYPARWPVNMYPTDSDGDGVVDINDRCISIVGPASNGGCPVPSITTVSANPSTADYNGRSTISFSAANSSNCDISGVAGNIGSSGNWTTPSLTKGTNFILVCHPAYGFGAGDVSQVIAVAVNNAPPPPVVPSSGGSKPSSSGKSTQTKSTAAAPAAPAAAGSTADTTSPSNPGNLKATSTHSSATLSWDAASDNVAVTGYVVERSLDQADWQTLSDNVTDTSYQDDTIAFNKHYFYRVYAKDAAGNSSNSAITEVDTGSFGANVKIDFDASIISEDGHVGVVIPAGASDQALHCEMANAPDKDTTVLPKNAKVYVTPTRLLCKNDKGDEVNDFKKPLQFTVSLPDDAKKASTALQFFNNGKWVASGTKADKQGQYKFEAASPKPFAVLAATSSNLLPLLLGGGLLLLVLIAGLVFWRRRQGGSDYSSYVSSQYPSTTAQGSPTAHNPLEGIPTPSSPVPGSVAEAHAPGQHQIDVKSTPVSRPGANPFHSPLDRLKDMEQPGQPPAQPAKPEQPPVQAPAESPKAPGAPKDPNDFLDSLKAPGEGMDKK